MVIYGNNLAEKLFGVSLSKEHLKLATPYCEIVDDPDFAVDVDLAVDFHAGLEGDMAAVRRSVEILVLNSSLLDWSTINFYVDKMKVHPYYKDEIRRINDYFNDPNYPNFKDDSSFGNALSDAARDCLNSPCNVFSATSDSIGRLAQPAATKTSENAFDLGDLKGTTTNLMDGLDQAVFNDLPSAFQQGILEVTSVAKEAWSSTQSVLMGKSNITDAVGLAQSSGSMRSSVAKMYNYTPDLKSFFDFDQMGTAILAEISNSLGGCFDKFQHTYRYNPYTDNMSTPLGIDIRQVNGVPYHADPGGTYTAKGMTPASSDINVAASEPASSSGGGSTGGSASGTGTGSSGSSAPGAVEGGTSGSFFQIGKGDILTKENTYWISKPLVGTNAPTGGSWPYIAGGFIDHEKRQILVGTTGDFQIDSGDTGIEGMDRICPGDPARWIDAADAWLEEDALGGQNNAAIDALNPVLNSFGGSDAQAAPAPTPEPPVSEVQLKEKEFIVHKVSNGWSHDISREGMSGQASKDGLFVPLADKSDKIFNDGAIINKALLDRLNVVEQGLVPLNMDIVKAIKDGKAFITIRQSNECSKFIKIVGYKENALFPDAAIGLTPAAYYYAFGKLPIGSVNTAKTESIAVEDAGWVVSNTKASIEGNTAVRIAIGEYHEMRDGVFESLEQAEGKISCKDIELGDTWREYIEIRQSGMLSSLIIGNGGSKQEKEDRAIGLLNPALIQKLIELSQELGVKIPLNSGRRNKAYMQSTGQSKSFKPGSQHNIGNAVDVSFRTGLNYNTVNAAATKVGFTGIGKYSTFIHLDVRRPPGSRISRW
jgi:hypothetical protein